MNEFSLYFSFSYSVKVLGHSRQNRRWLFLSRHHQNCNKLCHFISEKYKYF